MYNDTKESHDSHAPRAHQYVKQLKKGALQKKDKTGFRIPLKPLFFKALEWGNLASYKRES